MKVEFLSKFSKDIDLLNLKSDKAKLLKLIQLIEVSKSLSEIPKLKKLTGHKNAYRIRIGNYRVGFFFQEETVLFARVVHRQEIYKVFP